MEIFKEKDFNKEDSFSKGFHKKAVFYKGKNISKEEKIKNIKVFKTQQQNKWIQKISSIDGLYIKETKKWNLTQTTIFDGIWWALRNKKDNLLYNIRVNWKKNYKRLEDIVENIWYNLSDIIIWVDFTNHSKNKLEINSAKDICYTPQQISQNGYTLWEKDNVFIFDTKNILKQACINSLALWWAVADCAGICWNYNNWEIISLSHVWWQGILNKVLEQLIYTYKAELWNKEIKNVIFDISPTAWINYEWEKNFFDIAYLKEREKELKEKWKQNTKEFQIISTFLEIFETYNINPLKDNIIKTISKDKVYFYLDRIIKRIFLENWIDIKQLNFHPDYTTDLNNKWPSYRIHTLWQKGIIEANWTQKSKDNIVYDSRMWIFNIISIKQFN